MDKNAIVLESLEIVKNPGYVDANPNCYVAKLKIRGSSHETEILLTPEISAELMQYLSPLIVKHATQAAEQIAATMQASIDAMTNTKQITDTQTA